MRGSGRDGLRRRKDEIYSKEEDRATPAGELFLPPKIPEFLKGSQPRRGTVMNDSALLRNLMDYLPDAVFFKDIRGRFIRINRVLASWYGLDDPADAIGKSEADFYPQEFARATLETEAVILKTGIPILDQEEKVVGRDGKGAIVGMMGVSRDIKSVKRAEEKARDSEALYQSLIESLPQCIFR